MTKIIPMRSRGGLPSTRGKGIATCMKQASQHRVGSNLQAETCNQSTS